VREVLTQALASGYLTESRGRRIYLSNAVVLLTADLGAESARLADLGNARDVETAIRQAMRSVLGETLIAQCDVIVTATGKSAVPDPRRWLQDLLATDLSARYRQRGIDLHWDESVVDWLLAQGGADAGPIDWARLVDDRLSPLLARSLAKHGAQDPQSILIKIEGNQVQIGMAREKERSA
jgi:ATP-dependent Clp protease ATP-binding subunit ClpC